MHRRGGENVLIRAVADDIIGASDLCLMMLRAGLQVIGVPTPAQIADLQKRFNLS